MTTHQLKAGPKTIMQGMVDPRTAPALVIDSGDTVVFDTRSMWDGASTPDLDLKAMLALRDRYRAEGRGPHSLTGPIAVRGAKPGDVLRVEIQRLEVSDHGINVIFPGQQSRGLLAEMFPEPELRHFKLDRRTMTTTLGKNVTIPLRPFLGIVGVLPAVAEPISSSLPGNFGGNIDCPDLVVGASIHLPVQIDGAGFFAGDAHAAQGCGEVSQTALETSMTLAQVKLTLVERPSLKTPRAETADTYIAMGFDVDLRVAAQQAIADMIDLLGERHDLGRSEAYSLCSLQADLLVTQAVNGINGVHARVPKAIFRDGRVGL